MSAEATAQFDGNRVYLIHNQIAAAPTQCTAQLEQLSRANKQELCPQKMSTFSNAEQRRVQMLPGLKPLYFPR